MQNQNEKIYYYKSNFPNNAEEALSQMLRAMAQEMEQMGIVTQTRSKYLKSDIIKQIDNPIEISKMTNCKRCLKEMIKQKNCPSHLQEICFSCLTKPERLEKYGA